MIGNKTIQKCALGCSKFIKRLILFCIFLVLYQLLSSKVNFTQIVMLRKLNTTSSIEDIHVFMKSYFPLNEATNTSKLETPVKRENKTSYIKPEIKTVTSNKTEPMIETLLTRNTSTVVKSYMDLVSPGGSFTPTNRKSDQKIALVIPYRDREEHLKIFLRYMHPFLQKQQLNYRIFIIEMDKDVKFNRAILMNIGFVEAMKLQKFTCFVFHDVDLIPENNKIPYSCTDMPRHLSVAVDTLRYKLPYNTILGGAVAIRTDQFKKVNGMSNMFFGWGGEDDDFSKRVRINNYRIVRPSVQIARYKMILHKKDTNVNTHRWCLLDTTVQRMEIDGLSNLKYTVKSFENRPLYTTVLVYVNETELANSNTRLSVIYNKCQNNGH